MKVRSINEFPPIDKIEDYPDLILYSDDGAMGIPSLLIYIINNHAYFFNTSNNIYPLYKEYLRLIKYYYPEIPLIKSNNYNITSYRKPNNDSYLDYYLGMGNYLLIKKDGKANKTIKDFSYPSIVNYINEGWSDEELTSLIDNKISYPKDVLFSFSDKEEILDIESFLKTNNFIFKDNKEDTLSEKYYLCVDCENKIVSYIPTSIGENKDLMFFDIKFFDIKNIIKLTLIELEKKD